MSQNLNPNPIFGVVFISEALAAFTNTLAPITALTTVTSQEGNTVGDSILVPYCANLSASVPFSYATGYNTQTSAITAKNVVLNTLNYQTWNITDADASKISTQALAKLAGQCGARLANDVLSQSLSAVVTDANYPVSASCTYSQLTSSAAFATLTMQADNDKWPETDRNLIVSPEAFNAIISNTNVATAYAYGGADVVQDGKPKKIFGWNIYKTNMSLPNNCKALAVNPNAILWATGIHKVNPIANGLVEAGTMTSDNGIAMGSRCWYSPTLATATFVVECLNGVSVGNIAGLYQMK
jgi:hypothetical protein